QGDGLIIHANHVLQQVATHLPGEAAERGALFQRSFVVDNQDRLDRVGRVVNVTQRSASFDRADYRQAIQRNTLPGAFVDLPAETGHLAHQPAFGVGEAGAGVHIRRTGFDVFTTDVL